VDTSAFFALLDRDDPAHGAIAEAFDRVLDEGTELVTHNYVLVETLALAQRRLGMPAVVAINDALLPVMSVEWIDSAAHEAAVAAVVAARRRSVSLVDHVSFALMRRREIGTALAVDRHFAEQGFTLLGG
jgi:uncharacterized protein